MADIHDDPMPVLEAMTRIALEAGRAIMAVYDRAEGERIAAETKADDSPVTEADLAADAIISAGLAAEFPEIAVVTEEQVASQEGEAPDLFFIVDPLDGTKEFVQRRGDFTVNIALVEHGRPLLGVVLAPARRRLFRGAQGHGATQEETDELLHPLPDGPSPISVRTPDPSALSVVASKSHMNDETRAVIEAFDVAETRNAGSSLKFCLVAAGEADFYPRMGRTMEWDTAAGHAVLAAAGGEVRVHGSLRALAYGKPGWDNPHFLAYAPGVPIGDLPEGPTAGEAEAAE
ncbi:MAG: 3'(2'),5'-bisphosphate nucleotidase CysQ [Pseudomonadota bacterium]